MDGIRAFQIFDALTIVIIKREQVCRNSRFANHTGGCDVQGSALCRKSIISLLVSHFQNHGTIGCGKRSGCNSMIFYTNYLRRYQGRVVGSTSSYHSTVYVYAVKVHLELLLRPCGQETSRVLASQSETACTHGHPPY